MKNQRKKSVQGFGLSVFLLLGFPQVALAEKVDITLIQMNDVYEIEPVEQGKSGGLARVAALRQQLLRQNQNTYTILAGDLFSPSAYVEYLAGKQVVAVMNALGLDYATFGNHEFDLKKYQFLARLQESRFQWFSSNVTDANGNSFPNVPKTIILEIEGDRGAQVRVGLIGVTLNSNLKDYVKYSNPIEEARKQVQSLEGKVDILIGVTHLSIEEDRKLAAEIPQLDLILGGHEHENIQQWRLAINPWKSSQCRENLTPIFKADANARTVYIHQLSYDTDTRCLKLVSYLQPIVAGMPEDAATKTIVEEWVERGVAAFRKDGFELTEEVTRINESLDGLESSVRSRQTNLTKLIARSLLREVEGAELSLYNSGSIRIDDYLPPGTITEYDIIRIMPFGGRIVAADIQGGLLQRVLDQGEENKGTGGYLQKSENVTGKKGNWFIQGQPLNPARTYRVAVNDFLLTGREKKLDFFTRDAAGVTVIAENGDIRFALIKLLREGDCVGESNLR